MPFVTGNHRLKMPEHPTTVGNRNQRIQMGKPIQLLDSRFEAVDLVPKPHDLPQQLLGIVVTKRYILHVHSPLNINCII